MGIPKFFRWISERYPCLNELVTEHQVPEFDNMYLDMNGIIHNCSHPNDAHNHRITHAEIFKGIFDYLDALIRMVRPRRLIFLAVDGVAPRAKMNQQRARRFRAAKDAAAAAERERQAAGPDAVANGSSGDRFDSNCITPGTSFMVELQQQLEYFVQLKMSTDPVWQRPRVVLSGHEVPGEGEHKIMDYIRYLKSQPSYNTTTRHCLYGLDADLMMLGLCTHEPNFSLLREEVKFSSSSRSSTRIVSPAEIRFFLLHLSLFREYLDLEFKPLKSHLRFGYDLERIIDDWIVICFLVGNDFLPHLPGLHIASGALPLMYDVYKRILPSLDGYLNDAGTICMDRFLIFLDEIGKNDFEEFANLNGDVDMPVYEKSASKKASDLTSLMANTDFLGEVEEEDEACKVFSKHPTRELPKDTLSLEFYQHKRHYYNEKMDFERISESDVSHLATEYLRGLQWVAHYYFDGVASWAWFYPYHYAPYASDVAAHAPRPPKGFHFAKGKPFLPFQQLLGVLPAASRAHLPRAYHPLMLADSSPLRSFFPDDFDTDLNGKKQDWEAVVLIPFIDEAKLLAAMATVESRLTEDEVRRNRHSIAMQFDYSAKVVGRVDGTDHFPTLSQSHAKVTPVPDLAVPPHLLVKGPAPGQDYNLFVPGFPTFRHLSFTTRTRAIGVKVFEMPAAKDRPTLVLMLAQPTNSDWLSLLGKTVWVCYPHLQEALVDAVVDQTTTVLANGEQAETEKSEFTREAKLINERYHGRLGIDVGEIKVLLKVRLLEGRTFSFSAHGKVTVDKKWSARTSWCCAQTVVPTLKSLAPQISQFDSVHDVFTPDSLCFVVHPQFYGHVAKVLPPQSANKVLVEVQTPQDPPLDLVRSSISNTISAYLPGLNVCRFVGLPAFIVSRITGILLMANPKEARNRINIGLGLKMHSQNKEIPGYARRTDTGDWSYSQKAVNLIREYMTAFPEIFNYLQCNRDRPQNRNEYIKPTEVFTYHMDQRLENLKKWLAEKPGCMVEPRKCGAEALDPQDVEALENIVVDWVEKRGEAPVRRIEVDPKFLYKPLMDFGPVDVDPTSTIRLLDRVVCTREDFPVPLGHQGTVIGVEDEDGKPCDKIQVLFDRAFGKGARVWGARTSRCFCLRRTDVLNVSHGRRRLATAPAPEAPPPGEVWKQRAAMRSAFTAVRPQPPSPQTLPLPDDADSSVRAFFQRALTPS